MAQLAHDSIDRWPVGTSFAVHRPMQAVTLQVIVRTVFGVGEGPRFSELADVLTRALEVGAWPGLYFRSCSAISGGYSPWGRFVRLMRRASEILRSEIRRGREKGTSGRTDVLAMLLEARDEAGKPLTEDEIHDELITLLVAGHETTATSLAWALRWILPNGAIVARLREELALAGGDPARIAKLELLDATVKESLRLQPIIPMVGRVLQQPDEARRPRPSRGDGGRSRDLPRAPAPFALPRSTELPARPVPHVQAELHRSGSPSGAACADASAPPSRSTR